jgi:preprotein translocase subunit SecD
VAFDNSGASRRCARFATTDIQFKAKALLESAQYRSQRSDLYRRLQPAAQYAAMVRQALHAFPMYLGLDLRGGVHFLMQVDIKAVLNKRLQGMQASVRSLLRDKNIRHSGINRNGDAIEISFRDADTRDKARAALGELQEMLLTDAGSGDDSSWSPPCVPEAIKQTQEDGVKQNISTLSSASTSWAWPSR